MWSDNKFQELSAFGKLVRLYLEVFPNASEEAIGEACGLSPALVREALAEAQR